MPTRTPEPHGGLRRSRTEPRAICVGLLAGLALVSAFSHVCFGTGGADREYLATRGYGQYLPDTPWRVHRRGRRRPPLLILGSSKARNALFADMVAEGSGLAAINLAMSGFPLSGIPLQVETVLEESTVAPHLAVIGVSRSDVLADRYALRPLSACSAAIRALEGATVWARVCGERVMWQAARALLGVEPHRLRRHLLGLEIAPLLPERTARCTRGVVERNVEDLVLCESGGILRTRAAVPPLRRRPSSRGTAVDARAMAVLAFVRTALQKRGVGLRVALLPEWTADRADGIVLEALRTSGFQVYDLTDAGADDFYDPVHVNQAGGLALTTRLVQALSHDEHGLIGIRAGRPGDPGPGGR